MVRDGSFIRRVFVLPFLALLSCAVLPAQQAEPVRSEELTPERRADIYMARKMYREAIDQYKKAPETAVVLNKLGIAYHQLNDPAQAERYYKRAIKSNPKYPEAVNNLGTVYYWKKSYRKAVNQYKKALKLSPESASVYSNLGTAHFARKHYEKAAEAYHTALKLDPDVFEHKSSFGVLLRETKVEERAKFQYYLAKTYAQTGALERALQSIRKALESGFKDKKKFLEEPEFEKLRELPEFKELMAADIRVLE